MRNANVASTAGAIARHSNGQPILYYTWTPYWVSGALVPGKDVEWLDVPYTSLPDGVEANTEFNGKNLGFAVDNMYILASDKFLADNPAASKLLHAVKIDINDVSAEDVVRVLDTAESFREVGTRVIKKVPALRGTDSWPTPAVSR